MKKLKRPSVGNVERENERDQTYEAKNPKIDLSCTHDNYHIIAAPQSYMDFINKRIASLNLKRKVRSDAIYMTSASSVCRRDSFFGLNKSLEQSLPPVIGTRFK